MRNLRKSVFGMIKMEWYREYRWFFFFFQAEDGIRDYKVTGVQTCALPISDPGRSGGGAGQSPPRRRLRRAPGPGSVHAGHREIQGREDRRRDGARGGFEIRDRKSVV